MNRFSKLDRNGNARTRIEQAQMAFLSGIKGLPPVKTFEDR